MHTRRICLSRFLSFALSYNHFILFIWNFPWVSPTRACILFSTSLHILVVLLAFHSLASSCVHFSHDYHSSKKLSFFSSGFGLSIIRVKAAESFLPTGILAIEIVSDFSLSLGSFNIGNIHLHSSSSVVSTSRQKSTYFFNSLFISRSLSFSLVLALFLSLSISLDHSCFLSLSLSR